MELTIRVGREGVLMTRQAAEIAEAMKAYESRVLLRHENITVNAKSLMGLVSLGIRGGMPVTILSEGNDDAKAACAMAKLLGS